MATTALKDLIKSAAAWPQADQQELADYGRVIEARRTGRYALSADERAAIRQGLNEADRNEFIDEVEFPRSDQRDGA